MFQAKDNKADNVSSGHRIREAIIALLQDSGFSLRDKLLLIFHLLLTVRQEPTKLPETLALYQEEAYLHSVTGLWNKIDLDVLDSYLEINELFLDISQNYRKEKAYGRYLQDIYLLAEKQEKEKTIKFQKEFNDELMQFGLLLENGLVSKIFADCTGDDIDEMIMAFQLIVTEYIMVRYSSFLKWRLVHEVTYPDLRDYIAVYSRMIGYNAEGIREFWEESFDDAIWDFGYLLLLLNEE
jgi:lysine-N-methylase